VNREAAPVDRATDSRPRTELDEARGEIERLSSLLVRQQTFDRALLDGVEVGIVTTDEQGRIRFANRCARDILHRHGSLEGEQVTELFGLSKGPATLLSKRSSRRFKHAMNVGDHEVEVDLAVNRADEAAAQDFGFFFIFHDRTREQELELERRRLERLAAMGTMVSGFAHEVRNPMASLRSIAESLNDELKEANLVLPHVGRMLGVIDRVERLVRTSLRFGRPSPPHAASHRPWTILSAAVSAMLPRTLALGGELNVEVEPDLPDVFVDDGQIVQVLVILLSNAFDATGRPPGVLLRADLARTNLDGRARKSEPPLASAVRFAVRDDGPGIEPGIVERIFDPFFTTKAAGTGLGLSIAQQLATENAARIEVRSSPGGPTTFSVLVPIAAPEEPLLTPRP